MAIEEILNKRNKRIKKTMGINESFSPSLLPSLPSVFLLNSFGFSDY